MMKKLIMVLFVSIVCICSSGVVFAGGELEETIISNGLTDLADEFYEYPENPSVEEIIDIAARNLKVTKAYRFFFEENSYNTYTDAYKELRKSKSAEAAGAFMEAWQNLTQEKAFSEYGWYLWDEDNMPILDGEELTEEDFKGAAVQDNLEYRPFVIKYLLEDPSSAKGNLLINAGGERANDNEGYPVAEMFNSLGYNCFVVCRRCLPYKYEDKAMDLQRAIRLVKYHAQQEGWGGQDLIAAFGGSAGGIVILGITNALYGYNTPNIFDTDYVPDEIDQINSDLDAVVTIYFGGTEIEEDEGIPEYAKPEFLYNEENPNWPVTYLCSGDEDNYGAHGTAEKIYNQIKDKIPAMLHIIPGAGHGFGLGDEAFPETFGWPYEADAFMVQNKGHVTGKAQEEETEMETEADSANPVGDIPEKYTKVKYFYGMYTFTNSDVVFAMNDEETEFYARYQVMHSPNVIEGIVENGIVTLTYNKLGFADDDAQMMYEDAIDIEEPWETIER